MKRLSYVTSQPARQPSCDVIISAPLFVRSPLTSYSLIITIELYYEVILHSYPYTMLNNDLLSEIVIF